MNQGPNGHLISVTLFTMNKVYHIIDNKYKNSHNYKRHKFDRKYKRIIRFCDLKKTEIIPKLCIKIGIHPYHNSNVDIAIEGKVRTLT